LELAAGIIGRLHVHKVAGKLHLGHILMKQGELTFIVGTTASGKTERALAEAERRGGVILSCDSLCVYQGMDIGTAKPTQEELSRVPHYGVDLVPASEPFSVEAYARYCRPLLDQWLAEGRPVIVAGGSGFYLASFFRPVTDTLRVPDSVREEVSAIEKESGLEGLRAALERHNGPGAEFPGLDLQNSRRVQQALLRCLASGQSYAQLRLAFLDQPDPYPQWQKEVLRIERSTEELAERNRQRVRRMLEAGLVEEVRRLRAEGFEANPSAAGAIGYREVLQAEDGELPWEDLEETLFVHTRQLMRKQRSWLRHQIPVDRVL
jgi:tRNA dimethylallyltransferase